MAGTSIAELVSLTGKTALVTGGAVGIGAGIAARFAEAGANVVIADLDREAAEITASELSARGWPVMAAEADVAQEAVVQALIDTAVERFGQLDILVNNAGIYPNKPLLQMEQAEFERVIHVNLLSVYLCTRLAAQRMVRQGQGGRIINVSSIDALHPSMVGLAHYDASKHGVWGFTKNAALELAEHKIWVNAIAPGGIQTPGVAKQSNGASQEVIEQFKAKIPMNRFGDPDDIGRVALFLASDLSSYMTGTQVVVDGGVLLR